MAIDSTPQGASNRLKTDIQDKLEDYMKCRAWSHDWDRGQSNKKIVPVDGFHEVCRCTRCHTDRITWLNWEGHPIARWYEYPDDYQEVTSISKAVARLWLHNQHKKTQKRTA